MVYITGDMHGDVTRWCDKQMKKLKAGDILLVCGDFGFVWDGSKREKKDLDYLGSRKFSIGFVDGTHENFELLNKYRKTVWNGGKAHRISGNLFHLMRGQVFNLCGEKYFIFGGGESPDIDIRQEKQWWRDEFPTPDEMREGAENLDEIGGRVDYVVTHEPPSLVKSSILLRRGESDRINLLGGYFEELSRSLEFKHWYFGSVHEDRTVTPKHTALFKKVIAAGDDFAGRDNGEEK